MKPIQELSFGFNDAREYLQPESRPLLEKFFLADENLRLLTEPQRCFVVGEKGTGKTAYAAYLSTCSYENFRGDTAFLQDTDYLVLRSHGKENSLRPEDFVPSWELALLALSFLRMIREANSFSVVNRSVYETAEEVLDAASLSKDSPLTDIFDLLRDGKDALEIINARLESAPGIRKYSSSDNYRRNIKWLRQFFMAAVGAIQPKQRHIMFVDGIDVRPSTVPFEEYMEIVKALVNAVWVLNSERLSSLKERHLRLVLLLRPDILEGVGLHNLNSKIRDNSVILDWKTAYPIHRTSKLFRLCDRLLASQQSELSAFETGATWDHYFPYKVFNRRRDHDEASDASFIPFLRYSFYRPRDVITLMTIMQKKVVELGRGNDTQFDKEIIHDFRVRQDYSAYLLGEVKMTLEFYYKIDDYELFLKFFEFLDDYVEEFTLEFEYDNFVEAYSALVRHAQSAKLEIPVIFSSADRFLQFLYELNIIAFFGNEGGKRSNYQRWCFRERSYANIRPKVSSDSRYKMHLGIARALNAKRFG
jgi:hypothetical protein